MAENTYIDAKDGNVSSHRIKDSRMALALIFFVIFNSE